MATWAEFSAADADLAEFGHARLHPDGPEGAGIGYLATVRAGDRGPRVHPVCPFIAEGRLYLTIPHASPKRIDLRTDPRYMLHAFPYDEDAEFSVRGTARLVTTDEERAIVAAACSFATGVRDDDDVFELSIDRADSTRWENWAQADTYAVRRRWMAS